MKLLDKIIQAVLTCALLALCGYIIVRSVE